MARIASHSGEKDLPTSHNAELAAINRLNARQYSYGHRGVLGRYEDCLLYCIITSHCRFFSIRRGTAVCISMENVMSLNFTNFAPAYSAVTNREVRVYPGSVLPRPSAINGVSANPRRFQFPTRDLTFREVIVPLDGSLHAEYALPWAMRIAALSGGGIRIVHFHQKMQPALYARRLQPYREVERLLREPMEHYIGEVARRIRRASGVKIRPTVVDGFHVANDLSHLVAETSDIVVMATRGRNVISRTLLGSTLDTVLERRTAPVLHVPGYACPVDLTARPSLRHALVPLDGGSASSEIFPFVAALGKLATGRQTLLKVLRSEGLFTAGDASGWENESELTARSTAYLEEVATAWRHALPRARSRIVWTDASIAAAILKEVHEQDADCIVMTTRSRGRLKRLISPGVFDRLIHRARTPILVVKQQGDGDRAPSLSA